MHHSTETALIKIINDIRFNSDSGKIAVLILLRAAFDTVDHNILLDRLEKYRLESSFLGWYTNGSGHT